MPPAALKLYSALGVGGEALLIELYQSLNVTDFCLCFSSVCFGVMRNRAGRS